jgi:titin
VLVVAASLLSACGGGGGSDGGSALAALFPDTTPPTVSSTSPANGAIGVALDATISATASEALNPATLNATTFTLTAVGGGAVTPGSITFSGNTATFTPSAALAVNTQYIATITSGVKDPAGNALAANFVWSFTTITVPGAPVIGPATAGNAQATVTFSPPTNSGGAPVTNYTVTSNPGAITATGAASPIVVPGLINGTPYTFTVTADNMAGTGPPSAPSNSVTPGVGATVPGAPTIGAATAGNAQATVAFTPGSAGSSATLSYTVTSSPGGITASGAASPVTVPGLVNGTAYAFTVTAFDSAGPSPASGPSNSVTPATAPGAPGTVVASAGSLQATVSFTPPGSNGGAAITGYTVTSNPGGGVDANAGTLGLSHLVTGLINGTPYTFTVTATNAGVQPAGVPLTGPASAPSNSVTPNVAVVAPPAPGAVNAVASTSGPAQATVNFTPPVCSLPACPVITNYTVTSSPSGITASGAASPIVVPGLIAGTAYTFTVKATNSVGTSPASGASNSVTPLTVPGAPTAVTAAAGTSQVTVSFTAPVNTGGSPIIGYTATSNPGGIFVSHTGGATPITVTGLTNGVAYTFTVTAFNSVGTGPASASSNSATPIPAATVPGAPIIGTATSGNAQATVTFSAPVSDGNSPITGYTVISSPAGGVDPNAGTLTNPASRVITGLTNGTAYTFSVKATNSVGTGPASAASNAIVPATVPGAPTLGTVTAGNTQVTLAFTPPASNGGATITFYTATSTPGSITGISATSPIVVNGLTNGQAYTFTVTATNSVGTGAGAVSGSVTPNLTATVPGAPTGATAAAGNAQATVNFTAPVSNGGSAITGYTATASPGGLTGSIAGSAAAPITVTGLTNGTAYTFTVKANNVIGASPASGSTNIVTPATTPGAPTGATATAGNAQATVTFSAPVSNGGSAITGYTVTGGGVDSNAGSTSLTHLITGLTNGTTYSFTVTATNGVGTGPASVASNSVTPNPTATVPGAPTGASATAGNTTATVTFTAPVSNGGSAITGYTVTSSPAGGVDVNAGTTGLSHNITGLTNGTSYTFTVTATNAIGASPASGASNTVTPATSPGPPTGVAATPGNTQATVTFLAPASNGGSAITGYTVNITGGPGVDSNAGSTSLNHLLTGLTNLTTYSLTVTATNGVGNATSTPAVNVTPTSATVPGAPNIGTAISGPGVGQVTVTFSAGSTGGSPITGFTVASSPGGGVDPNAGTLVNPTSRVITGLTLGTAYTFTVKATNAIGISLASASTNIVTPTGPPGTPLAPVATATGVSGQVSVAFTAPASNGSPITGFTVYKITGAGGPPTVSGSASPILVTGLTDGNAYTFTVLATNSNGPGPQSPSSNSATPSAAAPTCPVAGPPAVSVVAGRTSGVAPLSVFFDASGTTSGVVTSKPFHEIEYQWNFGDPGGGNWFPTPDDGAVVVLLSRSGGVATAVTSAAHGFSTGDRIRISGAAPQDYNTQAVVTVVNATTFTYPVAVTAVTPASGTIKAVGVNNGISRNTAAGPLVAHVFETPGTYNVTLTANDGTNPPLPCSVQITVTDPNTVFAGANTVCVSATGTFAGCPSGATQITSGAFDTQINAHTGPGTRLLFNRGDVFTCTGGINKGGAGPVTIGAYGSGALPVINAAFDTFACFAINSTTASDWRMMDLQFNANGHVNTVCLGANSASNKSQITLLRVTCNGTAGTHDFQQGILFDGSIGAKPDQVAIVDSTFNNIAGEATFIIAQRYFEAGNYFNGGCCSPTGGGIINQSRHLGIQKGVISYNTFANLAASGPSFGAALTVRTNGLGASDLTPGDSTIISYNYIDLGNNFFNISVFQSVPADNQMKDIIVERNFIKNTSPNGGQGVDVEGVDRATVRNNIVLLGGGNGPFGVQLKDGGNASSHATNNVVYNNSIYSSTSFSATSCVFLFTSGVISAVIKNNACFMPNSSGAVLLTDHGTTTTSLNNSSDTQVRTTAPIGWASPPASYKDFKPTGGYLVGGGLNVPVWSDFFLVPNAPAPARNIGAVNP